MQLLFEGVPLFQEGEEVDTTEVVEEEDDGIELLLPETAELIFGALAFVVLFVIMWKVAFPAFGRMLANREAAIRADLEAAEKAKAEADSLLADYRQQLTGARDEANRIIEQAREAAESVRRDVTAKADTERQEIVARSSQEVAAERERAVRELREQVANLSLELAERVVGQTLDREAQLRLIENYINEVGGIR